MHHISVKSFSLEPHGNIPNNPTLPVLFYRQVLSANNDLEKEFKDLFKQNNWGGSWVNGVFGYHHYHSKSHEVLGVAAGSATLILGGPGAEEVDVQAGDLVVLPAGTGHCLKSSSSYFRVVGAYPTGQENYDICTEDDNMEEKQHNIKQVPLPTADPLSGTNGPLMRYWQQQQ